MHAMSGCARCHRKRARSLTHSAGRSRESRDHEEEMMARPTFQEWFCLREGRRNFEIDPLHDQEFLFGEAMWQEDIDSRLKRAQLLGTPVRLVWWGQYGIGKTHRLRHTEYLIKHSGYSYYPCYAVASDLDEKAGFRPARNCST